MDAAMNFEQYLSLKVVTLQHCLEEGREWPDPKIMNPIVLAYIGDIVFSSYVRLRLLPNSSKVRILHDLSASIVSAVWQCRAMEVIVPLLDEEESGVYHRGRNAKSIVPKSASVHEYREATAFEALLGYLFLEGRQERCQELLELAFKHIVKNM